MSASLNKAMIIGNLGGDPEIKYLTDGKAVATFSMATSDKWKDKQTGEQREKTEWHRIVMFGRLAELAGEYLSKGKSVYVEGNIQTRSWEDKDGKTCYMTEIVARSMQFLGGKGDGAMKHREEQSGQFVPPGTSAPPKDGDIPF